MVVPSVDKIDTLRNCSKYIGKRFEMLLNSQNGDLDILYQIWNIFLKETAYYLNVIIMSCLDKFNTITKELNTLSEAKLFPKETIEKMSQVYNNFIQIKAQCLLEMDYIKSGVAISVGHINEVFFLSSEMDIRCKDLINNDFLNSNNFSDSNDNAFKYSSISIAGCEMLYIQLFSNTNVSHYYSQHFSYFLF